ncbi:MAG: ThiF family adenylyltransferase [Oscillospiraceae bacterium]
MDNWLARQDRLVGVQASDKLKNSRVAIAGLGGVGGAAFEAIVRSGVGHILALDCVVFDVTNLNRQLLATRSTVGRDKCAVASERAASINPECEVTAVKERLDADNLSLIFDFKPDYIIDAIDCVTSKLALIEQAKKLGFNIITSMGTGNRIDASDFVIGDIETSSGNGCGLSRVMRRELRNRGISGVTALFSRAAPIQPADKGRTPASISFVPPVAGYLLAGYVIRQLIA